MGGFDFSTQILSNRMSSLLTIVFQSLNQIDILSLKQLQQKISVLYFYNPFTDSFFFSKQVLNLSYFLFVSKMMILLILANPPCNIN